MSDEIIPTYHLEQFLPKLPGFEIRKVCSSYNREFMTTPHRHSYYTFFLHLEGTSVHHIDFETYEINYPSLIFIRPSQVHSPGENYDFKAVVISFKKEYPLIHEDIPDIEQRLQILTLDTHNLQRIKHIANLLLLEYQKEQPDEHFIKMTLGLLLYINRSLIEEQMALPSNDLGFGLFMQYRSLLDEHYKEFKTVSYYAKKLNITAGYLNDISKKICGNTAKELIMNRVLSEAKRLLYFENLTMKEIAYHLGFNEVSYFNTFYKKQTGETPLHFRKTIREKYN